MLHGLGCRLAAMAEKTATRTVHGSFFVLILASLALWYKRESSNAANSIEKSIYYSHSKLRNLSNNLNPSYTTPLLFWLSVQIPSEPEYCKLYVIA